MFRNYFKTAWRNLIKNKVFSLINVLGLAAGIAFVLIAGAYIWSEGLQVGDASLLTMFGFPLLYGDAKTALNKPASLVITAAKAIKYFGKTDVLGQTLTIQSFSGSKQDFQITAVMKDPPHLQVCILHLFYRNSIPSNH